MDILSIKPIKLSQQLEQHLLQPPPNRVLTIDEKLKAPPPSPVPDYVERNQSFLQKI